MHRMRRFTLSFGSTPVATGHMEQADFPNANAQIARLPLADADLQAQLDAYMAFCLADLARGEQDAFGEAWLAQHLAQEAEHLALIEGPWFIQDLDDADNGWAITVPVFHAPDVISFR